MNTATSNFINKMVQNLKEKLYGFWYYVAY